MSHPSTRPARNAPDRTSTTRTDIQGLRAIAVGAVLLFHFWPHRLTGGYVGVDVFLVISGFLITDHLLRRPIHTSRDLLGFWARRIRRLIPSACLVLAATLAASLAWLPSTVLPRIASEVLSSAFYVENWYLAQAATDYLAAEEMPTPVQHYWSLSVEEQFYLLWPLLFAGVALVGARRPRALRWLPLAATGTVFALSLAYSIHLTGTEPARAYFVSTTRFWELAAGALLAAALVRRPMTFSPAARAVAAWIGLAMIGGTTITYTSATPFPGFTALVPVAGTMLVIAAAADGATAGPGKVLALPPVQWVGDVSYLVYLWHWPVLVITPFVLDRVLRWPDKIGLGVLTLVLSAVTKRLLEDPIRWHPVLHRRLALNFVTLAVAVGSVGVLATGTTIHADRKLSDARAAAAAAEDRLGLCFGAGAARHPKKCEDTGDLETDPVVAREDLPFVYDEDCRNTPPYRTRWTCRFGAEDPTLRIALIGNSHAGHWIPALEEVVAANPGAEVTTYLMSVCYTVDLEIIRQSAGDCQTINRWAIEEVAGGDYDLVVMSNRSEASIAGVADEDKADVAGVAYREVLERFVASGAGVTVIRDTPHMVESVPDCIAAHDGDWAQCTIPRDTALERDPAAEVAPTVAGVTVADVTEILCGPRVCNPVVGRVIAFSDHGHLTATFARTMAPEICAAMAKATKNGAIECTRLGDDD